MNIILIVYEIVEVNEVKVSGLREADSIIVIQAGIIFQGVVIAGRVEANSFSVVRADIVR